MDIDEIFSKFANSRMGRRQKFCTFIILCGQICAASHMVFMAFAGRQAKFYICRRHAGEEPKAPYPTYENETVACKALWETRCNYFEFLDEYASITTDVSIAQ